MTAAYQDERITVTAEGISVGQRAFTMNLVTSAAATVTKPSGKPPWNNLIFSFALTTIGAFFVIQADLEPEKFLGSYLSTPELMFLVVFNILILFGAALTFFLLLRCLRFEGKLVYNLTLDITGNDQIVLSSTDKDYIHMLAGLINTFKGYTPEPDPSFDYEGEVLE